jgi:RimJ/RimL family protein N-acetyltransferase
MEFETKHILLRPIEEKDLPLLHKWRNSVDFIKFCSVRRNPVGYEDFIAELKRDFEKDRHLQFIIEAKNKNVPIGTIYTYNLNLIDGYVFITVYLDGSYRRRGYGVEAVALLLRYLFESLPLHKIYMEVYAYNNLSMSILKRVNFVEEGRFKEHRFFEGGRHDLIRFAVYRNFLEEVVKFLDGLKSTKEQKSR